MFAFAKACPYLPALFNIVQNSWQWQQPNLPKQVWVRPIVCLIHKEHLHLGTKLECAEKWSEICSQMTNLRTTFFFLFFKDRNAKQNSPILPIWELCVSFKDRDSEQNSPKFGDKWPTNLRTNCSIHRWEFGTKRSNIINLGTMCSVYRKELGTKRS